MLGDAILCAVKGTLARKRVDDLAIANVIDHWLDTLFARDGHGNSNVVG